MKLEITIDELRDPESFLVAKIKKLQERVLELEEELAMYQTYTEDAIGLLNQVAGVYEENDE